MRLPIVATLIDLGDNPFHTDDYCQSCGDAIHTPDDRTGLIHKHGLYACYNESEAGKRIRLDTVAV